MGLRQLVKAMSIEVKDPTGSDGGGYDKRIAGRIYLARPPIHHTIYRDIPTLPDPTLLGMTIRYYNYDDENLYFQVTGSAPGYTFGTVNLGLLASGANAYQNLDDFASRARPGAAISEEITIILRAYTDAAYTVLKWTYERKVQVIFIHSIDGTWTLDVLNNFDDGTVQGWAVTAETANNLVYCEVRGDYVLSPPYSIRLRQYTTLTGTYEARARLYKSFTTPDKNVVYAIINLRSQLEPVGTTWAYNKYLKIQRDATVLIYLGRPYDTVQVHYFPNAKWLRVVVPLPKNTTVQVRIVHSLVNYRSAVAVARMDMYIDDFKIISK